MLGAAIIVLLRTFVSTITDYWALVLGVVLVFVILFLPEGVLGKVFEIWHERHLGKTGEGKSKGKRIMLEVRNVSKSFGGFKAVDRASLDVEKGEIVAVIGPNGAGKTTLFNVITGVLKPNEGQVIFKGEDITGLPSHKMCKKGIARSFQIVNIFSRLTVFENVQIAVLTEQGRDLNLFYALPEASGGRNVCDTRQCRVDSKRRRASAAPCPMGRGRFSRSRSSSAEGPELVILDEPTAGMSPEETGAVHLADPAAFHRVRPHHPFLRT